MQRVFSLQNEKTGITIIPLPVPKPPSHEEEKFSWLHHVHSDIE